MTDPVDIPLVYPLVSISFRTTQIVDGRPVFSECEELIPFNTNDTAKAINKLVDEFRKYLKKLRESVNSQQGRDALQNILDTQSRDLSKLPEGHPLTPACPAPSPADQGIASPGSAVEVPASASL